MLINKQNPQILELAEPLQTNHRSAAALWKLAIYKPGQQYHIE